MIQITFLACEHIPTLAPSGEQIDCPGVVQELVEAPVEAVLEDGTAPESELLLSRDGAGDATAEAGAGAAEGEPEEAELTPDLEDPEPDADPALDEPPEAPQLPIGATPLNPEVVSTDCPGSGNCTSPPLAVVHPVPMFATNNDGNDAAARFEIFELKYSS